MQDWPRLQAPADGNGVAARLEAGDVARRAGIHRTVFRVFGTSPRQEVVNLALDAVAAYFAEVRPQGPVDATLDELCDEAEDWVARSIDVKICRNYRKSIPVKSKRYGFCLA